MKAYRAAMQVSQVYSFFVLAVLEDKQSTSLQQWNLRHSV